ncbi:hypothetical protein PSN45_000755 [Yamadazyma tenuis]|uniref:Small ribosomal subunit protein mS29 n=1 Tax=Candida tenuis (strain ATCC 10573 / BCRC 21748 / CBS 615 / JCM 9827 / NBRC 10315 / NRRL Y-1498 / VKM Y-70) TaxID=590646 RepID=G3BAF0_CANTC|nr:mitochondrial ribosomal protein [Yamadazyma tenuis ATCC 10573]XP_006688929.1 uncharacterized protein CANTEDRAFT_115503 [Yamadazyma tenuis ATCC 10573]EGV62758.1 mitochondrial ribosomal protein [Yamadazyma tenuis ATCC 10573]EGV62759.1 hypothetical protein CANTEDRAFT_115503 [Yamadazyma tenuis ATCC 10573]WEJ93292.1 hypothetical protein PSN45_000755 [Yamadazyma tenuis]
MNWVALRRGNFPLTRNLHNSAISFAKANVKKKPLGGKTKAKQGFKTKNASDSKVKKSGTTHLVFKDAVRRLGYEKYAPVFTANELAHKDLDTRVGEIVKYKRSTESKLRLLGSFKKYQHHELFRNPVSLISENLIQINNRFVEKFDDGSANNRTILMGDYKVGKSTLISQTQSLVDDKYNGEVVLLHFDYPERTKEGTSDYLFNKRREIYQQPMFTKRWIMKTRQANKDIFSKMLLSKDVTFVTRKVEFKYEAGKNTLYEYLKNCHDFGKTESNNAFEFFISELKHHSATYPVLLSIDNFNALTTSPFTKYKHPDFKPIHFKEFEVGKFFLDYASGSENFTKGGVLLGESCDSGKHDNLSIALGLTAYDPYRASSLDTNLIERLMSNGGISVFDVQQLPKSQIRSLCEFYHENGVLFMRDYIYKDDDREVDLSLEQIADLNYTKSGGNPGLLLKHVTMSF